MDNHDQPKRYSAEHVRIFEHVGVSDFEDWKAVALKMVELHAPHLLNGMAPTRRKRGRPRKWDEFSCILAVQAVRHVRAESAKGNIKHNLKKLEASCAYLMGNTPEAHALRDKYEIPHGIVMETLRNKVSETGGWDDP